MHTTFSHRDFRTCTFEDVPLNQEIYFVDECWMSDWESAQVGMFDGRDYKNIGYISRAAVRHIGADSIELSWYPNVFDRFHEVSILLPRSAFVLCVECPDYDEKPRVFVTSSWLSALHLRPYSAFALIDAIGVKAALTRGELGGPKLVQLRNRIDEIAAENQGIAFVSFADSLLVKMNWSIGQYNSEVKYSYEPETLIKILPAIAAAYRDELGMQIYAAIAQGVNEYEDVSLLHASSSGNHISLNSLGLPFAQLLSIDEAARNAIRSGLHPPSELYIDEKFYHSLGFRYGFDKHAQRKASYTVPMSTVRSNYFCVDRETVLSNLDPRRSLKGAKT